MTNRSLAVALAFCCGMALTLTATQARAQFNGSNLKGDFGLQSGSQAPPGFYVSGMYVHYWGESLRDRNGNSLALDPEEEGSLNVNGYGLGALYVTNLKILGANYAFVVFPSFADNKLEVPILGLEQPSKTGFGDLYVQPIQLGWRQKQADFLAGLGLFIPTGRYDPDASDNLGLGMWSFELFAGTTVFFDQAKSWNLATTAFFETHTKKQGTDIKVGDLLTLEGGLGKSFLDGGLNVGVAYYAQWKLSHDDIGEDLRAALGVDQLPKHRVFGFGPDVTVPIATKKKLIATLNGRFFWETGARTTLQGRTLVVTATFPIPSVPLQ
jgi:hypothetical protein